MKTTLLALFFFFFFLFAFPAVDAIHDIDGDPVLNGAGQYHILPVFEGNGGGLTLARAGNETCPRIVVQAPSQLSNGLPVTFSNRLPLFYIKSDSFVDIEFKHAPTCAPEPLLWGIIAEDSTVGGSVEIAGNERFLGKFKIEEQFQVSENGYKLVYCPRCIFTCKDLGIAIDENKNKRLVARDRNPLFVQFKKANQSSEEWSIV